jgi:clan AA aspartic protease
MGEIKEKLKITNLLDINAVKFGVKNSNEIRSIEIIAIVDSGARMLSIPADLAEKLGLEIVDKKTVRYTDGHTDVKQIGSDIEVILTHLERKTHCQVLIERPGSPVLLGQIPMEDMDVVINMSDEKLTVNPESPYMPMAHQYHNR